MTMKPVFVTHAGQPGTGAGSGFQTHSGMNTAQKNRVERAIDEALAAHDSGHDPGAQGVPVKGVLSSNAGTQQRPVSEQPLGLRGVLK